MKFKLKELLESTILLEGRKEDTIKKYGEEHKEFIEQMSDLDPSGNNKYLDWMVKTSLGKNQDTNIPMADTVVKVVKDFHRLLSRIKNKDINSYKSLDELRSIVDKASSEEEESKVSKQAKKVFENDDVVIYAPLTVQASCKYGAGSKWCIAGKSNTGDLNSYFDDYSKHSNFYFLINKKLDQNTSPRHYKYALQYRFDGGGREMTWWDAQDDSHVEPPDWVTNEMISVIKSFEPVHKKIKLRAQLQSFLLDPKIDSYTKFRDMLDDKQKRDVINKIINNGNLNSQTFKILIQDLDDKQKREFINNYVKGEITSPDYVSMEFYLDKNDKKSIIINNPQLLNSYDVFLKLDEVFSEEEKYKISKKIDQKQINNTDSKVLLKKWSMSPEEREIHKQKSFYVFLSDDYNYIINLVKVDPLDPESYRTINMMKLRRQVQPNTTMYGVKTTYGLLDEYIGMNDSNIPENVLDGIRERVIKI